MSCRGSAGLRPHEEEQAIRPAPHLHKCAENNLHLLSAHPASSISGMYVPARHIARVLAAARTGVFPSVPTRRANLARRRRRGIGSCGEVRWSRIVWLGVSGSPGHLCRSASAYSCVVGAGWSALGTHAVFQNFPDEVVVRLTSVFYASSSCRRCLSALCAGPATQPPSRRCGPS